MISLRPRKLSCCFYCRTHGVALLLYASASWVYRSTPVCVFVCLSGVNEMWFGWWLNYYWSKGCAVDQWREGDEERRSWWHDKAEARMGTLRWSVGQLSNREREMGGSACSDKNGEYRAGRIERVNLHLFVQQKQPKQKFQKTILLTFRRWWQCRNNHVITSWQAVWQMLSRCTWEVLLVNIIGQRCVESCLKLIACHLCLRQNSCYTKVWSEHLINFIFCGAKFCCILRCNL